MLSKKAHNNLATEKKMFFSCKSDGGSFLSAGSLADEQISGQDVSDIIMFLNLKRQMYSKMYYEK